VTCHHPTTKNKDLTRHDDDDNDGMLMVMMMMFMREAVVFTYQRPPW